MKFENTQVWGFEHAIRGMRNPKNSWALSDSHWTSHEICTPEGEWVKTFDDYAIGPRDEKLMQTLIKAGPEHRKFMRQIFVSVDITAPLYWWKEFDTYKVGTVANSTSTMHKLTSAPITIDCFDMDDMENVTVYDNEPYKPDETIEDMWNTIIDYCETLRKRFLETNDKVYWKELVRVLPNAWMQKRTVTLNYENLLSICSKSQRRFHKLNEWSGLDRNDKANFISWARTLPYAQELLFIDEIDNEEKK